MTVEERYRSTLEELTRDRPGGPDLAAVIAGGRRRRRARRTAWAGAGVAVATVATLAGVALAHDSRSSADDHGNANWNPVFHVTEAGSFESNSNSVKPGGAETARPLLSPCNVPLLTVTELDAGGLVIWPNIVLPVGRS